MVLPSRISTPNLGLEDGIGASDVAVRQAQLKEHCDGGRLRDAFFLDEFGDNVQCLLRALADTVTHLHHSATDQGGTSVRRLTAMGIWADIFRVETPKQSKVQEYTGTR